MIEEYKFGLIIIDGKACDYDVEVRWTPKDPALAGPTGQAGEVLPWQRKESHIVDVEDVERAVEQNPDTIVIGTGESGFAVVTDNAQNFIREKGIKLIIDKTEEATKTFNVINDDSLEEEGEQDKIIGLFHLTC